MDDPAYAGKYCDGAEKSDVPGKIKQAADARFLSDREGFYAGGGAGFWGDSRDLVAAVDIGQEIYATSYATGYWSASAMTADDDWLFGGGGGWRLQSPTRLAPLVGIGALGGLATADDEDAHHDGEDNDGDGVVDEVDEQDTDISGVFGAVYPEYGVHFWWNPHVRLTGTARYWLTTEGASANDWLYGLSIAVFR